MTDFTQTWPQNYADQVEYIENLMQFVQDIDLRTKVVGLYQATEPTTEEMLAAWEREAGAGRPLTVGARLLWWDTNRNVLEQAYMPTYDVDQVATTLTIFPMYAKRKQLDIVVLASDILDADQATPWNLQPAVDQNYSHLWVFYNVRGAAAAANVVFGLQGPTLTNHMYQSLTMNGGAAAPVGAGVLAVQTSFAGPQAVPAGNANRYCYGFGWTLLAGYRSSRDPNALSLYTAWQGAAPLTAANRLLSFVYSSCNNVAAITALKLILASGSFRAGSKATLYALR